jgi:hypothetical protein
MSELTVVKPAFCLTPTSLGEAQQFALILSKTELVPKSYQGKPDAIVVAMAWGAEIGLSGLQAVQNIASINGRPSLWGDAALAVVMAHPSYEDHEERIEGTGDQMRAICAMKRKGKSDKTAEFSVADAKKAGLWGKQGPWTQYPQRMLQMRARGFAMRDQFPDALRGISLAEESQDIPERDITERAEVVMPTPKRKSAPTPVVEASPEPEPANDPAPATVTEEIIPETGEIIERPAVVTLSENQLRVIRAQLAAASIEEASAAQQFSQSRLEAIPASDCNALLKWIKEQRA